MRVSHPVSMARGLIITSVISFALFSGCTPKASPPATVAPEILSKIKFKLEAIHPDGLRGAPDGLTTVAYYFCIPKDEAVYAEVKRIDPGVEITPGSPTSETCGPDKAFCLSSTGQPKWREVLGRLTALSYVYEIRECFFEK